MILRTIHETAKTRDYQGAIEDYTQLIAKYPEDPRPLSGRAFALIVLGNTDRANEDANRAIECSPECAVRSRKNRVLTHSG